MPTGSSTAVPRLSRTDREARVLDAASCLFYARGVHEVGMDELIRATGLGKATVYRLFPTKDDLVGAYLRRLAETISSALDARVESCAGDPRRALLLILDDIASDLARADFRGCAFNNASIEFDDPNHPARAEARHYRSELRRRLRELAEQLTPERGTQLGDQLAVLIDGCYTSAAHLGPDGPAAVGIALARSLVTNA